MLPSWLSNKTFEDKAPWASHLHPLHTSACRSPASNATEAPHRIVTYRCSYPTRTEQPVLGGDGARRCKRCKQFTAARLPLGVSFAYQDPAAPLAISSFFSINSRLSAEEKIPWYLSLCLTYSLETSSVAGIALPPADANHFSLLPPP